MKFTDEDLSNLKAFIKTKRRAVGAGFIEEANLEALLHRLHCAEAILKTIQADQDLEHMRWFHKAWEQFSLWKIAKGETEAGV